MMWGLVSTALYIVFRPPVITGNTTLNEGDTLQLDCDTSNSRPRPQVRWLSPEGDELSRVRELEVMNIQRSAAGIYTCVAIILSSGATMNSTVNVTVQCECMSCMKIIWQECDSKLQCETNWEDVYTHAHLCSVYVAPMCLLLCCYAFSLCMLSPTSIIVVPCEILQSTANIIVIQWAIMLPTV